MKKSKNVPEIRFEGFTDAWEQRKLGELAEIVRGASPRPIADPKWFDVRSETGWLRISDVTEQNGRIRNLNQKISTLAESKTRVLTDPHLLISIAATVGKPLINYVKTGVHDGFLIFLNPKFEKEFMFQWLEMYRKQWNQYGQPGSQVNLNSEIVRNQVVTIPSTEEQSKIGNFFKKIDKLITLHQCKLEKLLDLKNSMLYKLFPKEGENKPELRFQGFADEWEKTTISELLEERNLQLPEDKAYPLMAFVAYEGIVDKGERYDRSALVKDSENKKYKRTEFGDFIYSSNNLTTGSIGLNKFGKASISPVYSIFSTTKKANYKFIGACLTRKEFINKMIRTRQGVVYGQWRIHEKDFLAMEILAPSVQEQKSIGEYFAKLDSIIELNKEKLEKLKNIKSYLLDKMFI